MDGWKDGVMLLQQPDISRFYTQTNEKEEGLRLWLRRLRVYKVLVSEAFLCALVIGLLSLASPFLIQILTDDVLVRGTRSYYLKE